MSVIHEPSVARPDFAKAKTAALDILKQFAFERPPIDPTRIARDLGVKVFFAKFPADRQNISGFFDAVENAIFVNEDELPQRQTFTIAHELGHKVLHEDWARSSNYRVLMRDQAPAPKDPIEQEANTFAAHLLVPFSMLERYAKIASTAELADIFAVSIPVIINRMKFEYKYRP